MKKIIKRNEESNILEIKKKVTKNSFLSKMAYYEYFTFNISAWIHESLLVFSFFLSVKFNIALPVFLVSLATADLVKTLLISLPSFGITAVTFYAFSRKLGFEIKLHELFVYYFFYSFV